MCLPDWRINMFRKPAASCIVGKCHDNARQRLAGTVNKMLGKFARRLVYISLLLCFSY